MSKRKDKTTSTSLTLSTLQNLESSNTVLISRKPAVLHGRGIRVVGSPAAEYLRPPMLACDRGKGMRREGQWLHVIPEGRSACVLASAGLIIAFYGKKIFVRSRI